MATMVGRIVVHEWLDALMGERERNICRAHDARVLCEDKDGNRLQTNQRLIESESLNESFWIDSERRQIIG
jgi:hypothetical protein